jgi:4'-phosphopantetheinyl transferase
MTNIFPWPDTYQIPLLLEDQVHVWVWDLDRPPLDSDWSVLSPEETLRARRFVYPQDRDRNVRAHAVMRTLLGAYTGIHPAKISFSTNTHGKPRIQNAETIERVRFNLTHSTGIGMLAVSRNYDLGIDIEHMRPIDAEIAEHHFSQQEFHALRNLPSEQWLRGFYRCWTSKEALLKGEGVGLNLPLDRFHVEVDPLRPPALIAVESRSYITPGWLLFELNPADDIAGILAVRDQTANFDRTSLQCFAFSR